jgi:hypothetical protein
MEKSFFIFQKEINYILYKYKKKKKKLINNPVVECSCEQISTRKLREVSFYYIMSYIYHLIFIPRKQSLGYIGIAMPLLRFICVD